MSEAPCVHHWVQADYDQPWLCCKCGEPMPAWKASNVAKAIAASRKKSGPGRTWKGKALTVRA